MQFPDASTLFQSQEQALITLATLDPRHIVYADGGWRVQDVIAHLTSWEIEMMWSIQAFITGSSYQITDFDLHPFNEAGVAARRDWSAEAVYAEWRATRADLITLREQLTDDQLATVIQYPSGRRGPCGELFNDTVNHQAEHIADVTSTHQTADRS
jgi:hypothetical protein